MVLEQPPSTLARGSSELIQRTVQLFQWTLKSHVLNQSTLIQGALSCGQSTQSCQLSMKLRYQLSQLLNFTHKRHYSQQLSFLRCQELSPGLLLLTSRFKALYLLYAESYECNTVKCVLNSPSTVQKDNIYNK